MIAYKAFDKSLTCSSGGNTFQYSADGWNEEIEANCAKNGFHCAENPLDCLTYYYNWDNSVYYMVEVAGDIDEDKVDSKISCTRMRLIRQLDIKDFVYQSILYIVAHPERCNAMQDEDTKEVYRYRGKFVIVQGSNPYAVEEKGMVIGMIMDDGRKVRHAAVVVSDGIEYMYRFVDGKITRCEHDE